MAHIVVAPDSFKGSAEASAAAAAIAQGWLQVRPRDTITTLPQADGGEGTLNAIAAAVPGASMRGPVSVPGPDGRQTRAWWLELADGTAVVELASVAGLPLMDHLDALGASTRGLGELLSHVLDTQPQRLVIGLGGSATTDGAAGAFSALGLVDLDGSAPSDWDGPSRGVDIAALRKPPPGGVELFTDVSAPLLGPEGAAAVFAPQKGATAAQVIALEQRLSRWVAALEAAGAPAVDNQPGAGAAGGAGYGFMALWGAVATPGAAQISRLTGLDKALHNADALVTGEGRFDATSLTGKVVGHGLNLAQAAGVPVTVIAGALSEDPSAISAHTVSDQRREHGDAPKHAVTGVSLTELAGSSEAALAESQRWLIKAGALAADRFTSTTRAAAKR